MEVIKIEINENQLDPNIAYPLSIYKDVDEEIKKELYADKAYVVDMPTEDTFTKQPLYNTGFKYVKVRTNNNERFVIIKISLTNQDSSYDVVKDEKRIKRVELNGYTKNNHQVIAPSIFYTSDGEAYVTPGDIEIIKSLSIDDIKNYILSASTSKAVRGTSRKRIF